MADKIYLKHYRKGEDICPFCAASLIWRSVGYRAYTPCDKTPVLCMYRKGSQMVVFRGELVTSVKVLTKDNAKDFVGERTFPALMPHVFTCSGIHKYGRTFAAYEKYR